MVKGSGKDRHQIKNDLEAAMHPKNMFDLVLMSFMFLTASKPIF
jgi:hypothetical protein